LNSGEDTSRAGAPADEPYGAGARVRDGGLT